MDSGGTGVLPGGEEGQEAAHVAGRHRVKGGQQRGGHAGRGPLGDSEPSKRCVVAGEPVWRVMECCDVLIMRFHAC